MLTIEVSGKAQLEIFGSFDAEDLPIDIFDKDEKVIWGRCYDPQNNMKDITLFDCFAAATLNFSSNFPLIRFKCTCVLIGIHISSLSDAAFFKANIHIPALQSWCPSDVLKIVHSDTGISATMSHSKNPAAAASARLDDGTTLDVIKSASYSSDQSKAVFERETFLQIRNDSLSVSDVLTKVRMFEDFLSIAVLSPVEHRKVVLFSEQETQMITADEKHFFPIELVSHLYYEDTGAITKPDPLFSLQDIKEEFESILIKLFSDKNILWIKNNLVASLERKRVFTSNDFLIVAQALDGFSIRYRKECQFLEQLKNLRAEFSDIKKVNLTEEDLIATRDSRDYYSHGLIPGKKKRVLDGGGLFNLTKKLRVLLICCFLNYFGIKNIRIDSLLNQCNSHYLRV